jgi:hypothetical protein
MGRSGFTLQHVVDAHGAQSAAEGGKSIRVVFSLVGLYLRVEKGFCGQAEPRVHMRLAKEKRVWRLALPATRGALTPADVLAAPEGVCARCGHRRMVRVRVGVLQRQPLDRYQSASRALHRIVWTPRSERLATLSPRDQHEAPPPSFDHRRESDALLYSADSFAPDSRMEGRSVRVGCPLLSK